MRRPINIMWFRQDLRTEDNPALTAAAGGGDPVVPLFILSENGGDPWAPSNISNRRQHKALGHLADDLGTVGATLVVRSGDPHQVIAELLREIPVKAVFWNRRYEPHERRLEGSVRNTLRQSGVEACAFDGNLLFDPEIIRTSTGNPYRVFTPFWRACLENAAAPRPGGGLKHLESPRDLPSAENGVVRGVKNTFSLSKRIESFLDGYAKLRDRPDHDGTSKFSTLLHYGEISPRQVWHAVKHYAERAPATREAAANAFLRQLTWREFAYHLLYHFPETTDTPMRLEFDRFPWREDESQMAQWKRGETGYPIVDAGMRQLAETGWIHNRARLVVASFLVKHLLIDWRQGASHFWETLEDADLANNTLGWQWIAGCGVDAAPYFRIFNPVLQGEKFDPRGEYVREWVPEIKALPDRWIHKPWKAPDRVLADGGVRLDESYPSPIVDHDYARQRALAAYEMTRKQ